MNYRYLYILAGLLVLFCFVPFGAMAQDDEPEEPKIDIDTVSKIKYKLSDDRSPYQTSDNPGGLNLKMPANLDRTVEYDPVKREYVFKEKIGRTDYRQPYAMSSQEYKMYDLKKSTHSYWLDRRRSDKGDLRRSFLPSLNLGGGALESIFGNNAITIVPQGSAELIFGLNTNKIDNPNISERLRKTTTFDFQEKIQMNVTGSIGDKVKLGVKYSTDATFEFENQTKLEYTGKEDDIVRKIEAGNVSLPLTGSLITGSQSLFGIKTELQFGKLNITTVVSQQKGESTVIETKGGAQVSEFNISIDQYEANRHFFLSQFFRDRYEESLASLPIIMSGVTITKIEVWITNKNSSTTDNRNIAALLDLGEYAPYSSAITGTGVKTPPYNDINNAYSFNTKIRDIKNVTSVLEAYKSQNLVFEKIENARKLTTSEYTLNARLGYISLSSALNSDEILGVAYEYTYNGKTYKVGELSSSGITAPQTLLVKLIKGKTLSPRIPPMWKLMMKNVYSLNAYQLNKKDFFLNVLYMDDKNGAQINYIPEKSTSQESLLDALNLDRVNTNLDKYPDGVFDFVEGATVVASTGRIFFPTLEPFNLTIKTYLEKKGVAASTIKKYVYPELYDSTLTKAKLFSEKNKYKLKGTYQSEGGAEISLNATNIPQGGVTVTCGGRKLTENVDYTVDYSLGRVKIINQGLLESGQSIKVSVESQSLFNFQTKTMIGTHLDYKFNDNFNLGATVINLTERPLTSKVNVGDEPISNTIWGLNGTYTTKSQFLTNMLDKIPFLDVKDPSTITLDGEFAQLIPGHSSSIGKNGAAYIDDFEGAESAIDLKTPQSWFLASIPKESALFPESSNSDLTLGYRRARLAWYTIDPLFLRSTSSTPSHIKKDANAKSSHYVREIYETDIFKNKSSQTGVATTISVLNLAYYPEDRGPYNYTLDVNSKGRLTNPARNWGGIMRELPTTDFESANIEFIEFWMMDPFLEDTFQRNTGGKLYFNLGNVSEDVLRDSRKSFENGLPASNVDAEIDSTVWGYVPTAKSLTNSFTSNAQAAQDVGLDGLNDDRERRYYKSFLDKLAAQNPEAYERIKNDPSSDDFHYFRGSDYDANQVGILERYKRYNGMDGNSPVASSSGDSYSGTNLPNTEDIDNDNNLNEDENYYRYTVSISPQSLKIGQNFIVDSVTLAPTFANGKSSVEKWYQFRIPIESYDYVQGSIQDFTSIRYMRMIAAGFKDSVIMRFARLQLIRGDWRRYNLSFRSGGESITVPEEKDPSFDLSTVNIEDNATKKPVNYVLPPGVTRQVDPSNPQLAMLNEQAMVMRVHDLSSGDGRAAYKTISLDMRQYKHLRMDVHAEQMTGTTLANDELTLFVRMGSDNKANYYEYEIPLKLTPWGSTYSSNNANDRLAVWPAANNIDIPLEYLQRAKQARNDKMRAAGSLVTSTTVFPYIIDGEKGTYYVCGNPNLASLRTIMIGIRHPYSAERAGQTRSAEVWVNELRLTDFDESGGWAANMRVTTKLSDWGTFAASGNIVTPGFGSIDKKVNERSKEEVYQYDVATNLEMGKFFPEKSGIQLPMYVGYSKSISNPEYNPLDPDIKLSTSLANAKTTKERDSIKYYAQTINVRKSINFTNVKVNKRDGKAQMYDISNWTFNFGYSRADLRNPTTEYEVDKQYKGGAMYTYQLKPKNVVPFESFSLFRPEPFRIFRDFNFYYIPNSIGFRTDMNRNYTETKYRNITNPGIIFKPSVSKDFLWNRNYDLGFDLAKSLKFNYTASNVARIDEPAGIVNRDSTELYKHWRDSVWNNIKRGGRTTHYQQTSNLSYTIPINKLPGLNWVTANARYDGTYAWDAAAVGAESVGNTINNSNSLQLSNQLNFASLYNKVPYFQKVTAPKPPPSQQKKKYKTIVFEKDRVFLKAGEPRAIQHKLGTADVTVKVLTADGKEIKGKTDILTDNKVNFTSDADYKDVKVVVEGKIEDKPNPFVIVAEHATRLMLSLKNASISWTRTQGMTLPGYQPKTNMMGMGQGFTAPGWLFVFGYQDTKLPQRAIDNDWFTHSTNQSNPVLCAYTENLNIRTTFEPISNLRIELIETRTYGRNQTSYYLADANGTITGPTGFKETGNFSMSVITISSAFEPLKASDNYHSTAFDRLKRNRVAIAGRLAQNRAAKVPGYDPQFNDGYGLNSQNVLIPAFMSAYCNTDPQSVPLDRFPSFLKMLPNWRASYDGLTKIDLIKHYARTVNLSHYYTSTYSIGSYVNNEVYDLEDLSSLLNNYRDLNNNWIPHYDVSSVSIREQFGPLVGIDITFVNNLSTKFEIRRDRNIVMSLTNIQITETNSREYVIGLGYKFAAPQFIIHTTNNSTRPDNNDINVRGDFSIRDNKTIIRQLTDEPTQASQGQRVNTFKLSADYNLTQAVNIRAFYDLVVNKPLTSSSYPTSNSNIGVSVRFSLIQ